MPTQQCHYRTNLLQHQASTRPTNTSTARMVAGASTTSAVASTENETQASRTNCTPRNVQDNIWKTVTRRANMVKTTRASNLGKKGDKVIKTNKVNDDKNKKRKAETKRNEEIIMDLPIPKKTKEVHLGEIGFGRPLRLHFEGKKKHQCLNLQLEEFLHIPPFDHFTSNSADLPLHVIGALNYVRTTFTWTSA